MISTVIRKIKQIINIESNEQEKSITINSVRSLFGTFC